MKFFLLLLLLMISGLHAGVCAEPEIRVESPEVFDASQKTFWDELSLVARKAAALGEKRFSKIKKVNDSYQLTAQAIQVLSEKGDVAGAIPLLRKASKKYDGNRMAHLLLGAAFEKMGDLKDAAHAYAGFYRTSFTLVPFETELIGRSSLQVFRGYIEKRFTEWEMTLPEPRVSLELQKMRSLVMLENSRTGQWINLILPLLVVVGLALMLLARMAHVEWPAAVTYFSVSIYLLIVLGYFLWAAHFFMGLPFLISIEAEYILFFGAGSVLICLLYAANCFFDSRHEPKTGDLKFCPHCHATLLNVVMECPVCKRPCRS